MEIPSSLNDLDPESESPWMLAHAAALVQKHLILSQEAHYYLDRDNRKNVLGHERWENLLKEWAAEWALCILSVTMAATFNYVVQGPYNLTPSFTRS